MNTRTREITRETMAFLWNIFKTTSGYWNTRVGASFANIHTQLLDILAYTERKYIQNISELHTNVEYNY